MRSIDVLLDDLKAAKGLKSDYALAKHLGVVPGSVQNWRHKRSLPDPKAINKIAEELGQDADVMLLEIEAQRSRTDYSREAWLRIAQRLQAGGSIAGFLAALGVSLLVAASPRAEASPLPFDQVKAAARGGLCVMSNGIRKAKTLLIRALGALGTFAGPLIGSRHVQSATPDPAHLHAA